MPKTPVSTLLEDRVNRIAIILLAVCLVIFALHNIVAYDVWWQLKTGQLVRQSGWPVSDPFSYGFPDRAWIEVRWLYCVVISLIYDTLGLNAMIIAKVIWLSLAGAALWAFGRNDERWAVMLGLLCALVLVHQRLLMRPELVTYAFLTATLLCLRQFKTDKNRVWLYPLPVLQLIWVNSHTLFVLGPVVLGLFVVAEWLGPHLPLFDKDPESLKGKELGTLAIAAVLVTLVCLINPYGTQGALFPLVLFSEIQSNNILSTIISEFRPPFAGAGYSLFFIGYILVLVISAAGFVLRLGRLQLGWLLVWGAFLYLSFLAERNVPLFGIVAGASIMLNFGYLTSLRVKQLIPAVCIGFCVVMIPLVASNYFYRATDPDKRFGLGVAERRFPIKAMAFVRQEDLPRPVFTNLGESSYTLFDGGPKSVYVDGRLEVYDGQIIDDAVRLIRTGENLDETVKRLNIYTVVANHENDVQLVQTLLKNPAWAPVYYDDSHIVFLRIDPSTQEKAGRLKIDWQDPRPIQAAVDPKLTPPNYLARIVPGVGESSPPRALGRLFLDAGNAPKAQQYFEEAVRLWPDDTRACLQLGVLYRAQKRESEAAALLARVPASIWQQRDAQLFAAETYETYKNYDAAVDAWQRVIAAGEKSTAVYERLTQAGIVAQRWDAAFTGLSELSKVRPNDVKIWNNLGNAADKANRKADAAQAFEKSLQLSPGQPPVWTQLGIIKRENGDEAGARLAFQQALAIDPLFEPARRQLETLKK